ncbi:MAG: M20 family metallopeptidase [Promethearchaeati archaeon SRVP18_Atabeyarchaeia-1]
MNDYKDVLNEIGAREDEIVKLCCDLIGFRSVNPPGDVSEIAGFVKDYLLGKGFKVETVAPDKGRVNVIASLRGGASTKTFVWNGHLDVVPPGRIEEWKSDPYKGTLKGSMLVGRGAADMKGSIASALEAASVIVEKNIELNGNLTFHFVPDEETMGKYGTGFLVEKGYYSNVDACIVGEGTCNQLWGPAFAVAEKGILTLKVKASGRSAHASMPFLGENAIDKLVRIIPRIEELSQSAIEIDQRLSTLFNTGKPFYSMFNKILGLNLEQIQRLYTRLTFSPGMIKGGIKSNVVPDEAIAEIDVRVPPLGDLQETLARIQKVIGESDIKGVTVESLENVEPSYQDPGTPLVGLVKKCLFDAWGKEPHIMIQPGGTDARFIRNKLGIPTVVLGPTSETAHSANEYVIRKDLTLCSKAYALIALEYLS